MVEDEEAELEREIAEAANATEAGRGLLGMLGEPPSNTRWFLQMMLMSPFVLFVSPNSLGL